MKFIKSIVALLLAIAFIVPLQTAAEESSAKHYVALGDSLAWGMNEQGLKGKGYSEFFAEYLDEKINITYHNAFSFPGDKTTDLLEDFANNVTATIDSSGTTATIQDEIKKADIISISIGANDILGSLTVKETGLIEYDLFEIVGAIQTVGANLTNILQQINGWNPNAEVYVMGIYNPFPSNTTQASTINLLVNQIESTILNVTKANEATFVSVKDVLASNATAYLPNPKNIHPSDAGYKAISEQFIAAWKKNNNIVEVPTIEFSDVNTKHWAYDNIQKGVALGFIKGYTDGTFKPSNNIEKVHFTQMLVRPLNITPKKPLAFTDLGNYNDATKTQIAAAHEALIVRNTNGKFNPKQLITRLDVARMIYAANTYVSGKAYVPSTPVAFKDTVSLSKEDQTILSSLKELGIASGYPDGTFDPNGKITRAEATIFILKFLEETK